MKVISYIMIVVITYLLQAIVFPSLFDKGWQPDLFLVWIILITLIKGRRLGILAAIVGGVLRDVLLGSFFGVHLFPYVIVAYIISSMGIEVYEEQWYRSVLAVAIGTFIDGCIRLGMLMVVFQGTQSLAYIWHFVWPDIVTNGILAIAVHDLLWRMTEREEYFW